MTDNPYQAPASDLNDPGQVFWGSFWGGPIAAVYFLRANYLSLGKFGEAAKALLFGSIFLIAIVLLLPFLPERFPNIVLPLIYWFSARQIATTTQVDKSGIEAGDRFVAASNWKVFGIGTATLVLFFVAIVPIYFVLDAFGLISLDP